MSGGERDYRNDAGGKNARTVDGGNSRLHPPDHCRRRRHQNPAQGARAREGGARPAAPPPTRGAAAPKRVPASQAARRQFREQTGPERSLLSSSTTAAVDSAFNSLAHTVLVQNSRTLDDLVREMLRPMLKAWLADHRPLWG